MTLTNKDLLIYVSFRTGLYELECYHSEANLHRKVPILHQMYTCDPIYICTNSNGAPRPCLFESAVKSVFQSLRALRELHSFFMPRSLTVG